MVKADKILREVFPGREDFTDDERRLVSRVIVAVNNVAPRSRRPRTDFPIGHEFTFEDQQLKVVRRTFVLEPKDACMGCWFKEHGKSCYGLRCSRFDRDDQTNVWFAGIGKPSRARV